jgi:hypothetical protein
MRARKNEKSLKMRFFHIPTFIIIKGKGYSITCQKGGRIIARYYSQPQLQIEVGCQHYSPFSYVAYFKIIMGLSSSDPYVTVICKGWKIKHI